MGVEPDVVNNGQEAIDAVKLQSYDLIFMDCLMPVMDGYEATRAIRAIEREVEKIPVPIIALTANASSDDRLLCIQSGLDDAVTKAFRRDALSSCLLKWLPVAQASL